MANAELSDRAYRSYLAGVLAVVCLSALALAGYIRFFPEYFMNEEFPMWVHQREVINTPTQERQRLIVLGDSRAKAGFKPSLTDIPTLNLSLGGISPVGGYFVLKKYLASAPAPEKLVISFSPFVLRETKQFRRIFWERPVRFSLLEPADLDEIFHDAKQLGDGTFGDPRWNAFRFALPDKSFGDLLAGSFFRRRGVNREIYRHVTDHNGHTFFGTKSGSSGGFKEVGVEEFIPSEMLQSYLARTIELAKQHQIETYWFTMPFNQSSGDALSPAFRSGYDEFLNDLGRREEIAIINGINLLDDAEFGDPSHVYRGVGRVTADLLRGAGLPHASP